MEKKIWVLGKEIIVFKVGALAQSFLFAEKFLKWTLAFIAQKEKIVNLRK